MKHLQPLQDLLNKWGIKYFSAKELTYHKNPRWKGNKYVLPPDDIIENIKGTIQAADMIRERYGKPIRVVSGYRDPAYNSLVGGAKRSQHKQFKALDLSPIDRRDMDKFKAIAKDVMEELSNNGESTGLGFYKRFVHIDTGALKFRRRW